MRFRIIVLAGLLFTVHNVAAAHTDLFMTEPEAGSTVEALDAIEFYFTEPLSTAEVRVLRDSDSQSVTTVINESTTHVTTTLDDDPDAGLYQVVWSVTAADDGHVISGSFSFEYDPPPTPYEMRVGIAFIVISVIAFVGLLMWQRRMAALRAAEQS